MKIRSRTVASNSVRWPWRLDLRSRPQTASKVRLRSWPRTTSSGSLKYEEVIILQTGYRTINGYFRHRPTYFRSDNGRYKQYPDTSGLLPVTPQPTDAISGHFRSNSGNTIAYRGHIRSLPVKFRFIHVSGRLYPVTSGLCMSKRGHSRVLPVKNLRVRGL